MNGYGGNRERKPINDKAILPLTIYQVNEELKEDSIFENQPFFTISVMGRLENFRRENNICNMLLFSDGTSQFEVRINLTNGKMPAFAEGIGFEHKYGDYFFVVIKPKFAEGEKKFYIMMIKPIDNFNSLTKHLSDVILSTLIRRKS